MLALPLVLLGWFFYTIRWSAQARTAAADLARARSLRIGMSADQVRHVMGHSARVWRGARQPPVWYYQAPFMSDGSVTVYFTPDSTVQRVLFPKGQQPSQRQEP
jgi:hypothetical protein